MNHYYYYCCVRLILFINILNNLNIIEYYKIFNETNIYYIDPDNYIYTFLEYNKYKYEYETKKCQTILKTNFPSKEDIDCEKILNKGNMSKNNQEFMEHEKTYNGKNCSNILNKKLEEPVFYENNGE